MKNISIIGSTGSIGENALAVVKAHPTRFRVVALAANKNVDRLHDQIIEARPDTVCLYNKEAARDLEKRLGRHRTKIVCGAEGLRAVSQHSKADVVLCALVGAQGITPILDAIDAGKHVGIANKEPLVMAGDLIMERARMAGVDILPVDSEHSAIWQCIQGIPGNRTKQIKRLILTASGGPFLGRRSSELGNVTPEEAISHPRWRMGKKISVDSATLMNKGLEIKEAHHLFGIPMDHIEIMVHPESVVHSMVELIDGSVIAQLGINDMKLPIQFAFSYPERLPTRLPRLDLLKIKSLTFEAPDRTAFPCLQLAEEAGRTGGTAPAVLNAANEVAVERFLSAQLSFLGIPRTVERVLSKHRQKENPLLDDILAADHWARLEASV